MQSTNKMALVKKLKIGKGIKYLLDEAYEIVGNPIAIFDTEYNLQAYTNVITEDPIWNELIAHGSFSRETQILFMEEGFIDAVANTQTTAFLVSDKIKYDRISGKLYSNYNSRKVHVANLIMVACNKPFQEDDAAVFEAICSVFSKEINKNTFYQIYGNQYQENYIRKLIDGEIEEKGLYAAHIAIVYNGFQSSMRLVVADIGQCDSKYSKLAYFKELFIQAQGNFGYAVYAHYIIIIINSNHAKFNAKRDLKKLYTIFKENKITAGVSHTFDNMFALRKHYDEAVNALEAGVKKESNEQFFVYK